MFARRCGTLRHAHAGRRRRHEAGESQNRLGALRAAVLGLALAVPVIATGSLLPSMVAHAATNLLTPLWMREALAIPEAAG